MRPQFIEQRKNARKRGIVWRFTFEQWCELWLASGHWEERGRRRGQYCMARFGDAGAYEPGNVTIVTNEENRAMCTYVRTPEHNAAIRAAMLAAKAAGTYDPTHSDPKIRAKMRRSALARWRRVRAGLEPMPRH